MINIYCFTSKDIKNIWAAVGAQKWAITPNSEMYKQHKTKGEKMNVGSFGIFYSTEEKVFTTPFVVKSKINDNEETDIWKGDFVFPFEIRTIGEPLLNKRIHISEMQQILKKCEDDREWNRVFFPGGRFDFVKSEVSLDVWEEILKKLM